MVTITRSDFAAAIEHGIESQSDLTDAEIAALRHVAATAAAVGRTFEPCFPGDPCCPITQANLNKNRTSPFWFGYDYALDRLALADVGGFNALNHEPAKIV